MCSQTEGLWERPRPPDCHLCGGALGGVRHGVEKLSTVGLLPQWYEWCAGGDKVVLQKKTPQPLHTVSLWLPLRGPPQKGLESMVTE